MIDPPSFSQEALRRGLVTQKQAAAHHPIDIQTPQDSRGDGGLSRIRVGPSYSSRFWTSLTTVISSTVERQVGGGIVTSGLFFHGTNRACTLGDTRLKDELCTKKKCSLCAIIRNSFDVEKTGMRQLSWPPFDLAVDVVPIGSKHKFSRFGPGIYTSACSSSKTFFRSPPPNAIVQLTRMTEADDYFKDVSSSKVQSRALLLNTVVYGNARELYHTDTSAHSVKSQGFHSVSTSGVLRVPHKLAELIPWCST